MSFDLAAQVRLQQKDPVKWARYLALTRIADGSAHDSPAQAQRDAFVTAWLAAETGQPPPAPVVYGGTGLPGQV
jgi:hypothetical protein